MKRAAKSHLRSFLPKNKRLLHSCCHHYFPFAEAPKTDQQTLSSPNPSNVPPHRLKLPPSDYAFEIASNAVTFGNGCLNEVGLKAKSLNVENKRVALFTDKGIMKTEHAEITIKSLKAEGFDVVVYDEVQVEPTDVSFKKASQFFAEAKSDLMVSIGGGSVMDTAKAANLYATYPVADFLDYVNPPIGRGVPVPGPLKHHIACPTTAGTGSECTGFAIFDLLSMQAKTGIASYRLKPTLAIVDPLTTLSLPKNVVAASGFDVLSHGLESFTAINYKYRRTNPFNYKPPAKGPVTRPLNQGQNPFADMGCLEALRLCGEYIVRAVNDPSDLEAREQMMLAAVIAGTAMGGVGVHLPHGMSYSVSGMNESFKVEGYPQDEPLVPHGISVILQAPSVFKYIASSCPDRHLKGAQALGADIRGAAPEDAGEILYNKLVQLMKDTGMPNGIAAVGFDDSHIDKLIKGTMPQKRVVDNAPIDVTEKDLANMFKGAMRYW